MCLVLGARVIEEFGNIIEEKRREQNLVLVIQTPVPRHRNQYTMTNVRYNKAFIYKGEGRGSPVLGRIKWLWLLSMAWTALAGDVHFLHGMWMLL